MNEKPKILMIGPRPPPIHGQARAFEYAISALSQDAHIRIIDCAPRYRTLIERTLKLCITMSRIWFEGVMFNPDIIYITLSRTRFGFLRDMTAILVGGICRAKVIGHLHGADLNLFVTTIDPIFRLLVKKTYGKFHKVVALSESMVEQFEGLVPFDKIKIVENACDDDEDDPTISPPPPLSEFRVVFLSNVLPSKGLFDVLKAVALVRKMDVPCRLFFLGEFMWEKGEGNRDEIERRYNQIVDELGIKPYVERKGVVTGKEKWAILRSSHCFVLPIRNPNEGQPLSIIEALRAGLPIITTASGGIKDIIRDGINGFIVPSEDALAIAHRIAFIYRNWDRLEGLRKRNQEYAVARFSLDRFYRQIKEVVLCS